MNQDQKQNPVPKSIKSQLSSDYFRQQIALLIPKHMTAKRFTRIGLTALTRTPKLAECTWESILKAMMTCSELGLEPDGRRFHLIPYFNNKLGVYECQGITDYKGLVELCRNNGDVSMIHADIVCDKDNFVYANGEVNHVIDFRQDRGPMFAAYVIITFKDGSKHSEVMTKSEIDGIRKRSKASGSGPWVTDYTEMAKKTCFRRATKWIKLSPEIQDVLDQEAESASVSLVGEVAQPQTRTRAAIVESEGSEDDMPMGGPGESSGKLLNPEQKTETLNVKEETKELVGETKQPASETTPAKTGTIHTIQDTLAEAVTKAGFTFDDWRTWTAGIGEEVGHLGDWSEVPLALATRHTRGKTMDSVIKGIAGMKGKLI